MQRQENPKKNPFRISPFCQVCPLLRQCVVFLAAHAGACLSWISKVESHLMEQATSRLYQLGLTGGSTVASKTLCSIQPLVVSALFTCQTGWLHLSPGGSTHVTPNKQ
ncbi:hypothetical protein AMECASPLE_014750 [Ameca splendens]|uniref:Uncharacterized protein n=1 Tax=Ameca splendens TaxID=208324 RepID=A0ABV0ZBI7_9TELE